MNINFVKFLKDPIDGTNLNAINQLKIPNSNEIISGELISKNGNKYKIKNGIPVFFHEKFQSIKSVESFAYEWDQFGFMFAKNQWIKTLIKPLVGSDKFFKNKVVLDAGAGSGSQSRWIAEAGAQFVFSLELSNSIFSEHKKTILPYMNKIFPIQCDIAHPPIKIKPDIIYCMNVIQHTKNPATTLKNLAKLMHPKSVFFFNIYDKDKNPPIRLQIINIIRLFTRYMPFTFWKWISFILIFIFHIFNKIPFLSLFVKKVYPLGETFKGDWLNLYDMGGAHYYQNFYDNKYQLAIIKAAGLKVKKRTIFGYLLTK